MMSIKFLLGGIGSLIVVPWGIYQISDGAKITIGELIEEDYLDTSEGNKFKNEWKELKDSLKNDEKLKTKNPWGDKYIQKLKDIQGSTSVGADNGDDLREWCESIKDEVYWGLFSKNEELTLLAIEYCIYTIDKKLGGESKIYKESDSEALKQKVNELRNHQDSNIILEEEFEELKNSQKNEENDWKILLVLCEDIYESGYKGEQDNRWLLSKKYCQK